MGPPSLSARARLAALGVAAGCAAWVAVAARAGDDDPGTPRAPGECRSCHVETCDRWERSAHALSVRPATEASVPPDVAAERGVTHAPGASAFRRADGGFVAETAGDDGASRAFPLRFVVGVRRMQMLVAELDDGRLQVLPAMREAPAGPWFDYTHLLFAADGVAGGGAPPVVAPGEPSFWTGPDRSFDVRCARCHTSGREPLAPGADGRGPRSRWRAPGVDCVACHGEGAGHVEHWRRPGARRDGDPMPDLARRDRANAMAVCLPCHLEGEVLDPAALARPGADPLDAIEPTLLDDVVRTDAAARPRELMYEGLAFLTSTCAERGGLTCSSCHEVHGSDASFSLRVPPAREGELCAGCHADLVAKPSEHAHHAADGEGARCTACHLPPVPVERGHGAVRDHSIGVPRPGAAAEGRAQDACAWCHGGGRGAPRGVPRLDDAALAAAYAKWWPDARRRPSWADAVDAGRRGAENSADALAALAADVAAPRLVRASALRLLGDAPRALLAAARDPDPVLRRAALTGLASVRGDDADRALLAGLADAVPSVRFVAARSALRGWSRVRASAALRAAVLPVLAEDAAADPEDHLRWFRLGAARQIAGDVPGAVAAYERKLALDPSAAAVRATLERLRSVLDADGR